MFIICLRFVFVYLWPNDKTSSKKYVNINGNVSKDKWQSMFRYLAWWSMNSRYFPFATFTPVFLPPPCRLLTECFMTLILLCFAASSSNHLRVSSVLQSSTHITSYWDGSRGWSHILSKQIDKSCDNPLYTGIMIDKNGLFINLR